MAWSDPYVELDAFKARLNIVGTEQDDVIAQTILAASRAIDGMCGREFNKSENDEYRFFDPPRGTRYWNGFDFGGRGYWGPPPLELGDVVSITEVASDDGTNSYGDVWDVDSYVLYPRNQAIKGKAYREVRRSPNGTWSLTGYPIRVAGIFGWPAVPDPIVQATMRYAERLWALSRAPLGLQGAGDLSMPIRSTDADVRLLVKDFKVRTV